MPATPSPARASVWEWTQTALLAANLAWTTLCLGGSLPKTMVVTGALTGGLLAVHLVARALEKNAAAAGAHPAGWLLLPFLACAAANVMWVTPVSWLGWRDWYGWAAMIAIFWVALNGVRSPASRRALFMALVALGVVAALLACYQRFTKPDWLMLRRVQVESFAGRSSGPFAIPNSLAAFLLLLIPVLGVLTFRRASSVAARVFCGWVTTVLTFGLVLTISRGAWLGLALALVAWPLAVGRGSWWRRLGVAAVIGGALLIAGGALYAVSPRVRERFALLARDMGEKTRPIMWRAAWGLFREHPALGSGAGSYNVLFEKHRPERFPDEPKWAHNDYLNTLSDYGAAGLALFFGACGVIAWRSWRFSAGRRVEAGGDLASARRDWIDDPRVTQALGIGVLAFALQLFVDFHFKIPALAMAFATVAALCVGQAWPVGAGAAARTSRVGRIALTTAAAGGVIVTGLFVTVFRAEGFRFRARESIDQLAIKPPDKEGYRVRVLQAEADLARAVVLDPRNGQAWSDLSYATSLRALAEQGRDAELGREAEAAADRALAISRVCSEFWIRRGVARDMQGRWLDGGSDFTQALALAPTSAAVWYYYADHLGRKPTTRGLMEAALAFCLRLDPGNPEGLALRQRLAISQKGP